MKYVIKNVGQSRQYQFNDKQTGRPITLVAHAIMINDNGQDIWCEMSTAVDKPAPRTGEELEGEIKYSQDARNPHKFKKQSAGGGYSKGGYKTSPEVQASIIRQNALTNAVSYVTSKVDLTITPTVDNIIAVAERFYQFSSGKLEPKQPAQDIQQSPPFQPQAFPDDKIDGSDINISEIPF